MKCKKCGAELPTGATTCPDCGLRVEKKKLSTGATIAISAALVLVVAGLFALLILNNRSKQPAEQQKNPSTSATGQTQTEQENQPNTNIDVNPDVNTPSEFHPADGSYTWPDAQVTDELLAAVVASCGNRELTNADLTYYYWYGIRSFLSTYGEFVGNFLDVSQPLDEQYYDGENEITWQSYFLEQALSSFQYYAAMNQAAEKANYKLPDEVESYLSSLGASMAASVSEYGYSDVDSYLQSCFGKYATLDGYVNFTRTYLTGSAYASELQNGLSVTEDDVEAYFTEHEAELAEMGISRDGTRLVNVRHILIMPEDTASEDDWTDAKEKAEDIYAAWKKNGTEDSFAQMAANFSEDPGSVNNGGLYENVFPGETYEAFNDWCFDSERKAGDSDIVKSEAGYHIMYLSGFGEEYWYFVVVNSLMSQAYAELEEEILTANELVTDYDKIILMDPVGMYA